MRALLAPTVAAVLALAPLAASAQTAAPPSLLPPIKGPAQHAPGVDPALFIAGAGAVVGIVAFNVLSAPLGTVPLAGAALAAVPTEVALGSRMIAGLSGAAGALLASKAYDVYTGEQHDVNYLLALGAGATAGVAAGNLLAGWAGTMPYYSGAGWAAAGGAYSSAAAQAASRVYVVASGVLGAWAADYLYGVATSKETAGR